MKRTKIILAALALCLCAGYSNAYEVGPSVGQSGYINLQPRGDDLYYADNTTTGGTAGPVETVTNALTSFDKVLQLEGGVITNISVDPYFTYAPKAPDQFGGGLFAAYNINENVGLGIGLDWLGGFSLVSGDVTLRAPFHITTVFPMLSQYSFFQNVVVTPFVIAGVATPYSGNGNFNGVPFIVSDIGGFVKFGHVLSGQFNTGFAYGKWTGQGPYGNVTRYHVFIGWARGF